MPPAAAVSRMALLCAVSHCRPKVMVPRQRLETRRPVRPSFTCCMTVGTPLQGWRKVAWHRNSGANITFDGWRIRHQSFAMKKIAVIQGAPSAQVQDLFRAFVEFWQPSVRIAGVVAEGHDLPDRACTAGYLVSLTNGERFQIFQDLGPGSKKCQLAGAGALAAADSVRRDIAAGYDLVGLSQFGRLWKKGGRV